MIENIHENQMFEELKHFKFTDRLDMKKLGLSSHYPVKDTKKPVIDYGLAFELSKRCKMKKE